MQLECKMAAYSNHASASRTVIDYTTASSSAKSVAAAKAASDSNLKKRLTFVKNTASKISDTSTYLKADDDTQRNITISSLVKKNYFVSQVYKYIILTKKRCMLLEIWVKRQKKHGIYWSQIKKGA